MKLRLRLTLTAMMNGSHPLIEVQMVRGLRLLGIDLSKYIPPTSMNYSNRRKPSHSTICSHVKREVRSADW